MRMKNLVGATIVEAKSTHKGCDNHYHLKLDNGLVIDVGFEDHEGHFDVRRE